MHALTRQLYPQPASDMTAEDREDEAWERREQWIADHAPTWAAKLVGSEDFAYSVLTDGSAEAKDSILQDVGRFFERMHNAPDNPDVLAQLAIKLWREVTPYVEAAATEQATTEVAAQYDADMAQMERNAA